MKLKFNFIERNIMDEYILVPSGEAALSFAGLLTTTESGNFLFNLLKEDISKEQLVLRLTEEYNVDKVQAAEDVEEFIKHLRELNLLEE